MRAKQCGRRAAMGITGMVWFLSSFGGASWTAALSAQDKQDKQADSAEYQKLVQQGLREYQLGNFSEAKAFFAQAHALSPNARTLRGLGMSSYELRHYVEAIQYFQEALDSNERPLTLQMRGEVSQLLTQARAFITRLKLTLQPTNAEVRVDTRPVKKDSDGAILLDPGTHELVVEAAEHESITRNLRTDGGETLALSVSLRNRNERASEASASAVPEAGPAAAPPDAVSDTKPAGSDGTALGPWLLIGGSAAVAITGAVFLGLALSDKATVENPNTSGSGPVFTDYEDAHNRVFPFSVIGITALSVGGAGLIGGLIWKFTASGGRESAAQLEVAPSGLRLRARF